MDYDSLDFYNSQNIHIGSLLGSYFNGNHKMIIHSSRGAEMVASTDFVAGSNEKSRQRRKSNCIFRFMMGLRHR